MSGEMEKTEKTRESSLIARTTRHTRTESRKCLRQSGASKRREIDSLKQFKQLTKL